MQTISILNKVEPRGPGTRAGRRQRSVRDRFEVSREWNGETGESCDNSSQRLDIKSHTDSWNEDKDLGMDDGTR